MIEPRRQISNADLPVADAGSAADPGEYGKLIAGRLCPDTLPYELGTFAAFEVASFNGRALGDDALDVMLTLATNTPLVDGLALDRVRIGAPPIKVCIRLLGVINFSSQT